MSIQLAPLEVPVTVSHGFPDSEPAVNLAVFPLHNTLWLVSWHLHSMVGRFSYSTHVIFLHFFAIYE